MENLEKERHSPDAPRIGYIGDEENDHGLENGLYGKWTIRLRNIAGILAVVTTCIDSLFYVWTAYISVSAGHGWPDRTSLFIITCGPIIVAFTFMNSGKILKILSQTGSLGDYARKRTIKALTRDSDNQQPPAPPPTPNGP